jgi:predicted RND superfamily exporter protein
VDTVRVLNRALSRDDPAEERIPPTRGGVAELLFLAPKGHLDRFTNVNHSRANLLVRTGAVGTSEVRALSERLQALLADGILPAGVEAGVTGNAILLARSADGIARSQPASVALAAGAILLLITLGLRSPKLGAVAMVPNVLPVLLFFGLLGTGVAPLSLPTSLIGSVALGIAIDDTAHLLVRYREERRSGASPDDAVVLATRRVGRPVAITSAMLVAGFCVVALSGFATLREFGLLSALTMGICLTSDLLLLPALLVRTRV